MPPRPARRRHAAVDRRAAVSRRRRRRPRHYATTLADALPDELIADLSRLRWLLRHGARLVVPPAQPRHRLARCRPAARRALLPVRLDRARPWLDISRVGRARGHARRRRHLGRALRGARRRRAPGAHGHPRAGPRGARAAHPAARSLARAPRRHRKTSMRGPPIISACSTCIASTAPTPPSPRRCSSGRSGAIRALRAHTRACRSCISRRRSCTTRTTSPAAAALARRFAERGLELDPLDPFVNFTMGRTYWLHGRPGNGPQLARACDDAQPAISRKASMRRRGRKRLAGQGRAAANMSTSRCA